MRGKSVAVIVLSLLFVVPLNVAISQAYEPLPAIAPIPADNSLTPEKVELGKMLFFDPRLSSSDWISCATCHNPAFAFADRIPRALGHKMSEGPRNTPTILNAAFLDVQFWDGRAATLEEQALGPIQADIEMNANLNDVVAKLKNIPEYVKRFKRVFGGNDPVTPEHIAKAIAAFERTLITPNSAFDRYLRGDKQAINPDAKKGAALFDEKGCTDCHSGAAFSDSDFHTIKVPGSTDLGRYKVTKKESDKHAFRTPSLRNVELTHPYMNNGSVKTLAAAVKIMAKEALEEELSAEEIKHIVAFLKSLTGVMPELTYPILR